MSGFRSSASESLPLHCVIDEFVFRRSHEPAKADAGVDGRVPNLRHPEFRSKFPDARETLIISSYDVNSRPPSIIMSDKGQR
jgi:hypothetical protein